MLTTMRLTARQWMFSGIAATLVGMAAEPVEAALRTKTSSGDWFSAVNWTPKLVPLLTDDVILDSSADVAGQLAPARSIRLENTLSVGKDGGLSVVNGVFIGSLLDTGGTLDIDGENALVSVGRDLRIGNAGVGEVKLQQGTVAVDGELRVGGGAFTLEAGTQIAERQLDDPNYVPSDPQGTLTVSGADSKVFALRLTVGSVATFGSQFQTILESIGDATFSDGARLSTRSPLSGVINRLGTMTVRDTDTIWTTAGDIRVEGSLTVSNGGAIDVTDATGTLEVTRVNDGEPGSLVVDGAGSRISTLAVLDVGSGNRNGGELTISRSGAIHSINGLVRSHGVARVTGAGSLWSVDEKLRIGADVAFDSHLTVANGGAIRTTDLDVGSSDAGSSHRAVVSVDGAGSTIVATGQTQVGSSRGGLLQVTNGGAVRSAAAMLGQRFGTTENGGIGAVLVDGKDSAWTVTDALTIGTAGTGTLTVANRGTVAAQVVYLGGPGHRGTIPSLGTINIGAAAGEAPQGAGILAIGDNINIHKTGKLVFNHTEDAYQFATKVESVEFAAGTIEQRAGTTILSTDQNRFTGATHVIGGKLVVNDLLGSPIVEVESGATLAGSGNVNNVLAHAGATIAPGNSPGTLNVNGNLTLQQGAILLLEIAGTAAGLDYDVLNVSGNAAVQGGILQLVFLDGFAPSAGQQFDLLKVGGLFSGVADVQLSGLQDGWLYDVHFDAGRQSFVLQSLNDGISAAPVPLPSAVVLMFGALACLGSRRRVTRRK